MVQELLRILGDSHKLTKASLHLLLQPHLTELSLRPCSGLVSNAITQLVTVRCKFLTSLDLHSCSRVPASSLALLVEGLPRLAKLCLSDTQCDTLVLSAVGSCCQRLRELDISHCRKVTPSSLLRLVYDTKCAIFRCQVLRVLLVREVKQQGSPDNWIHALCFLLLAVPTLEQLSHSALSEALHLIHAQQFSRRSPDGFPSLAEVARARKAIAKRCNGLADTGNCPSEDDSGKDEGKAGNVCSTLRLKRLEELEEEDVPMVGTMCQGVEEVAISLGHETVLGWSCMQWPSLTRLTLHCPGHPDRSLEEVVPTLQGIGHRLQLLSLQNLLWSQENTLRTLLSLCPNLRTFQCHLSACPRPVSHNELEVALRPWGEDLMPLPLPALLSFNLLLDGCNALHPLTAHALGGTLVSLLCGCPKLETLSLWGVSFLLDTVFEAVLALSSLSPLSKLKMVSLCRSHVTQWGASLLLRLDSELESLDLSHCQEVTRRDYHRLQERVHQDGRNVSITWQ
ncbi:uncharacterized protein WCC33_019133 [Rhinophrynus dorsalis]